MEDRHAGGEAKTLGQMRQESAGGVSEVTPDDAQERLGKLGYTQEAYEQLAQEGLGSHYLRALVHIASGQDSRKLTDVFQELFPDETHGSLKREKQTFEISPNIINKASILPSSKEK